MRQAVLEDEKNGRNVIYRFRDDVWKPGGGDGILATLSFGPYRVYVRTEPEAPGDQVEEEVGSVLRVVDADAQCRPNGCPLLGEIRHGLAQDFQHSLSIGGAQMCEGCGCVLAGQHFSSAV